MSYKALQLVSRYQFPAFLACKFNGKPFNFRGSTLKTVFYELAKYLNPDGFEGWASYSTLAEGSGLSQRTVILAVKALELLGLLEKQKRIERKGNHCPNIYRFTKKIYECDSQRHASTAQGLCSGFITKRVKENSNINNISNARAREAEKYAEEAPCPAPATQNYANAYSPSDYHKNHHYFSQSDDSSTEINENLSGDYHTNHEQNYKNPTIDEVLAKQQAIDLQRNYSYSGSSSFLSRWQIPTEGFKKFWQTYPRKTNFANALKSWNYNGLEAQLDKILADIEWRKLNDPDWKKIESTQHPRTYLENKRWLEEKAVLSEKNASAESSAPLARDRTNKTANYVSELKASFFKDAEILPNLLLIVQALIGKFGVNLFASKYPIDCLDEWARVASEYSDKTLKEALTLVSQYHPQYPPTPIQFDALCRKTEAFNEDLRETEIVNGGCDSCKNPERPAKRIGGKKLCYCCHEQQRTGKSPWDWRTAEFEAWVIKSHPNNNNFFDHSRRAGAREEPRRLEYLYLHGEGVPDEIYQQWRKWSWKEFYSAPKEL